MLVTCYMFFGDHLPLGKITHDHGSLNQCVSNEMGCFMQTVLLLVAFLLRDALIDFAEVDISARLLLTPGTLRPEFIQLLVVPLMTFEATNGIDTALLIDARCQGVG